MRGLDKTALRRGLLTAHEYTKRLIADLSDEQLRVPESPVLNPFLWEFGHVGWFAEHFALRWQGPNEPRRPSILPDADRWFDSSRVAHDTRWSLDLPARARVERYVRQVFDEILAALDRARDDDADLYRFRLALYHEDMHGEAFAYMRHTLHMAPPPALAASGPPAAGVAATDVDIAGGPFALGSAKDRAFVFDNEKWAHEVGIAPFAISNRLVSNGEYAAFVDDGGYRRDDLWSDDGRRWRDVVRRAHPRDWRRDGNRWSERVFDRWQALAMDAPVRQVTAHEADAYCRWARRRLPSEAEWECAATSGAIAPAGLWEWTASAFVPFPGFSPDAYADYSAPWFGSRRVLRGASFATSPRMIDPRYRNFFEPERDDIFAGIRTCAPS